MFITLFLISLALALLSWPFLGIFSNYRQAQRIGLPILFTPINQMNPIWALAGNQLAPLLRCLPFGLGNFVKYSTFGWGFADKFALHARLGDAFTIVGPGENHVMIANAEMAEHILTQRKQFVKSEAMYKPLEMFGPNVDTVEGETWQRHRRITTPPFNERNSNLVWRESLAQAGGMLHSWISTKAQGITCTSSDTMTLALHVLTAAGFGKSYSFAGGLTSLTSGHSMTYKDSLQLILGNLLITIMQSMMKPPSWAMPKKFAQVNEAMANFKQYMVEMVEEERTSIALREEDKDNLMSVLVRASESSKSNEKDRNGLTDDEIYGNLFIYNLAGHETTANTLAFVVALLASDAKWQDWVGEEIETVLGSQENMETWEYEKAFPRLKRCLALMYETLRLYGPVVAVPKYTNTHQTLTINNKEYTIPPKTYVYINSAALHTMPRYWGSDSLVWQPDRWITGTSKVSNLEQEEIFQPPPGTYVPWSLGPRVCPGMKFSKVEFVAVIARLFQQNRVSPVLEDGESPIQASKRILDVVEDSSLKVTLQMRHPENIKLIWRIKA